MHHRLLICLCIIIFSSKINAADDLLRSIAQVRVTGYEVEFKNPWQRGSGSTSYGSAVLINGDRLITNAHVIAEALRIEVKRGDSDRWYQATIDKVGDASDLALLVVEDNRFYKNSKPVTIGKQIILNIYKPNKEEVLKISDNMCRDLLANTVIENYHIEVLEDSLD